MPELLSKIRQRGYWQVVVRPLSFVPQRVVDISSLLPMLTKCVVRMRGWDFPHIDQRSTPLYFVDWIGQEAEWQERKGIWRFYQSGQFIYVYSMAIDWRDESTWWPADQKWKPMTLLGVGDTVYTFAEIFEFASQLALTDAGDEKLRIEIKICNLSDRQLYVDSSNRWPFDNKYSTQMQEYPISIEKSRTDLISNHRSYAIESAREFFKRFGWQTTTEILDGWLERLR